ncbi:protein argonaute 16-like [Rhodamnia argentea]|uniref:Protein argonaute 16-like n=1 Tax=Rhodamnia argentea TaxID=178133 RepID=A0ABM3HLW9_9MYRT|nr:protein argonaute 16-like [Rhodamnia argentea]
MGRGGKGNDGRRINLLTNHFKVSVNVPDAVFYQYSVSIASEDKRAVEGKGIGRKLIDKLYQTYSSELAGKKFAYDGENTLYTVGPLPQNKLEFTVVLEDSFAKRESDNLGGGESSDRSAKRSKCSFRSRTFQVEISYAARVPLKSIFLGSKGKDKDNNAQDALRVLDIALRQTAAKRGCLLVRQSFFHDDSRNFTDVGGGVAGVKGFHASFRPTEGGLSLNRDVTTTMILTPGPVIKFLLANQNVKEHRHLDWAKAKRMLKNLRVKTNHSNMEYKIVGLSGKPCNKQFFPMRLKNRKGPDDQEQTMDITVAEYFDKHRGIELTYSAYLPCLDVGKPNRPNYLPLELCSLVSLQRYTKTLSSAQRASLVEKSRQKPPERMRNLADALRNYRYDEDPVLAEFGISLEKQLTKVEGRVLESPKLKVGNGNDCIPRNGRWNYNQRTLLQPSNIELWVIVNCHARCDTRRLSRELIECARSKGLRIEQPFLLLEEDSHMRRESPVRRVERMFQRLQEPIKNEYGRRPDLILCVLSERKNSDIYGPWKRKCLSEQGVVTQCVSPLKINDQYLTNLLLKVNLKVPTLPLGGINSLLAIEHSSRVPIIEDTPTMILGMDVSHGSPGRSDMPSVAAVVSSRCWPLISRYRASVRSQSPREEMIDALYKPVADKSDDGIMRELLFDFYLSSNGRKPTQIIVFRDGVSESQFNQVLNIELKQIIKAYQKLEGNEYIAPKFTVIVAQKNHHTKLFQADYSENVPPGTVVDSMIVHPTNYDFYMCAHAGMIGTSRPAHYHVLIDEIGFSANGLQNLIHSLCYVYQRSTTAVSIVAPIYYAHLAAKQVSQFIKFEDLSESSSGQDSTASARLVPALPMLHNNVCSSMFFC